MNRAQKADSVSQLSQTLETSEAVIIFEYKGLTVADMTALRSKLRAEGATCKVTKNRLAQRAVSGTRFEGLTSLLKGPTCIATSQDPVTAAKIVQNFSKTNEKLVIVVFKNNWS